MGEEKGIEKKKKKSKTKDPEDPEKKKKKKKQKGERDNSKKSIDSFDKDSAKDSKKEKKDKKDKKKKKKDKSTESDGEDSPAVVSDDEKEKSTGKAKSEKKKKSPAVPSLAEALLASKTPKYELFDADQAATPTEDAKKYGDVTSAFLQKKCKKIYKLLNFDPWNDAHRYDDDDMCDYVLDNPEPCTIKFEFDGFSGCIYPLSMCYSLKASRDTVEAVYDAFPAAIRETDWWIGTPYHYASSYGAPLEIVQFLFQKDPKGVQAVNYFGRTALHMGALFKAPFSSMELVCNKYPMACQIKDKDGYIPLHLACENGASRDVVNLLVSTYPSSVYAAAQYGMTPLHFAASHNNPTTRFVIQTLLDSVGENSNILCKATDQLGHIPLHMALLGLAPFEVIEVLVSACPETVWMKTEKGDLPLALAERKRAPAECKLLLEQVMERILVG